MILPVLLAATLPTLFTGTDVAGYVKVPAPGVRYRMNMATATSAPWVDSNLWRYQRDPNTNYLCEVKDKSVVTAVVEAFTMGVKLAVQITPQQKDDYEKVLAFLKTIPDGPTKEWTNFSVIDDGSAQAGEVMNLLWRRSIGYRIAASGDYTLSARMTNAYEAMQEIREKLGDHNRVLRIFGSELTLARALREGSRVRLHLVNYGTRSVDHLRIRLEGRFRERDIASYLYGDVTPKLVDFEYGKDFTEFTLTALGPYGVLDLKQ